MVVLHLGYPPIRYTFPSVSSMDLILKMVDSFDVNA